MARKTNFGRLGFYSGVKQYHAVTRALVKKAFASCSSCRYSFLSLHLPIPKLDSLLRCTKNGDRGLLKKKTQLTCLARTLFVTGHSLGGALATISALQFRGTLPSSPPPHSKPTIHAGCDLLRSFSTFLFISTNMFDFCGSFLCCTCTHTSGKILKPIRFDLREIPNPQFFCFLVGTQQFLQKSDSTPIHNLQFCFFRSPQVSWIVVFLTFVLFRY